MSMMTARTSPKGKQWTQTQPESYFNALEVRQWLPKLYNGEQYEDSSKG
jgi:hypothetical protein